MRIDDDTPDIFCAPMDKHAVPLNMEHLVEHAKVVLNNEVYSNYTIISETSLLSEIDKWAAKLTATVVHKEITYENEDFKNLLASYWFRDDAKKYVVYMHSMLISANTRRVAIIFYENEENIKFLYQASDTFKLEPGYYEVISTPLGPAFNKVTLQDNIIPILNENYQEKIIEDAKTFFESEQFYKENGFAYRRGLLMYGSAGTGKTSSIKYIATKLNVPTLSINVRNDFDTKLKSMIEMSCPNGCIVVIEDIDGIETYKRSELLNFIDGLQAPRKCYFIATTNYIDRVDFAFSRRPSRFDTVLEVPTPDFDTRKEIIKLYFKEDAKELDLDSVAKKTDGFSGAYFKELYILFKLTKLPIDKAIARLKKHIELAKDSDKDDTNYFA